MNAPATAKNAPQLYGKFSESFLQKVFYGSLIAMLLTMWFSGFQVGFTHDELDMNAYGKANYRFYMSGGKDLSFLGSHAGLEKGDDSVYNLMRYYGNSFELIAIPFIKITGLDKGNNELKAIHMLNELFAIFALLFTGLAARKISNWRGGIFTIWLLFLTPAFFGLALFDNKDIPFCAAYIATIYFVIKLLEELPNANWKTTLGLTISFYFAINTRLAGVLLLFYLLLFIVVFLVTNRKLLADTMGNAGGLLLRLFVVSVGGTLLYILTCPFILMNPIHNIIETLTISGKFPESFPILFEGKQFLCTHLPARFIPRNMLIMIPVFQILSILIGLLVYFINYKKYDWKIGALLFFSSLFPLAYSIVSRLPVNGTWRHFIFIYPGLCIIAGIGLNELFTQMKTRQLRMLFLVVCCVVIAKPVIWCIKNHPYEYTYFNEFAGGFKNAYFNEDAEYYLVSVPDAVDWLMKNEHIQNAKDTVRIVSVVPEVIRYYISRHYPGSKVKCEFCMIDGINSKYWTYAILNPRFLVKDYIKGYFPPSKTIHSIRIDGLAVAAVVKNTVRLDWLALQALRQNDLNLADSLYDAHILVTHDTNPGLYGFISYVKASQNKDDEAIAAADKCIHYDIWSLTRYYAFCGKGLSYLHKKQYGLSLKSLQTAEQEFPNESLSKQILAQVRASQQRDGMN